MYLFKKSKQSLERINSEYLIRKDILNLLTNTVAFEESKCMSLVMVYQRMLEYIYVIMHNQHYTDILFLIFSMTNKEEKQRKRKSNNDYRNMNDDFRIIEKLYYYPDNNHTDETILLKNIESTFHSFVDKCSMNHYDELLPQLFFCKDQDECINKLQLTNALISLYYTTTMIIMSIQRILLSYRSTTRADLNKHKYYLVKPVTISIDYTVLKKLEPNSDVKNPTLEGLFISFGHFIKNYDTLVEKIKPFENMYKVFIESINIKLITLEIIQRLNIKDSI